MNTERAIIIHSEFVKECVKVGRTVVEELREAIAKNEEISDEQLENLFTPLIDFVEKETDTRVSRETDEIRAKFEFEKELEEKEEAVNAIRDELQDQFVINVNGKRRFCQSDCKTKRLRWAMGSTKAQAMFPELQTAIVVDDPPIKDPSKLIDDPLLLTKGTESKVWYDYCPQVNINIDPPGEELLTDDCKASLCYLAKKNKRMETIEQYVPFYDAHQSTFNYYSNAAKVSTLATLCDNALNGVKLMPNELYSLMGKDNIFLPGPVQAARSFLVHHYGCDK